MQDQYVRRSGMLGCEQLLIVIDKTFTDLGLPREPYAMPIFDEVNGITPSFNDGREEEELNIKVGIGIPLILGLLAPVQIFPSQTFIELGQKLIFFGRNTKRRRLSLDFVDLIGEVFDSEVNVAEGLFIPLL